MAHGHHPNRRRALILACALLCSCSQDAPHNPPQPPTPPSEPPEYLRIYVYGDREASARFALRLAGSGLERHVLPAITQGGIQQGMDSHTAGDGGYRATHHTTPNADLLSWIASDIEQIPMHVRVVEVYIDARSEESEASIADAMLGHAPTLLRFNEQRSTAP